MLLQVVDDGHSVLGHNRYKSAEAEGLLFFPCDSPVYGKFPSPWLPIFLCRPSLNSFMADSFSVTPFGRQATKSLPLREVRQIFEVELEQFQESNIPCALAD